jgi:hypothetical protein
MLVENRISRRRFMQAASAMGISATATSFFLQAANVRAQGATPPPVAQGDGTMFATGA